MFFSGRRRPRLRPTPTFKPAVLRLEDRTVPSGFGRLTLDPFIPAPAGPATHLEVLVPETVHSGVAFPVLVEAQDAANRPASGYTGTVQFSLGTADAAATLPANYPFVAGDNGMHVFSVTLSATGSQTIDVADTTTASIAGSATTTVTAAPTATHLLVQVPEQTTTGLPTPVTVTVLDASNHPVPTYTGTVSITSSDTTATLPPSHTFVAGDNGRFTFDVTFNSGGTQTVTATDNATTPLTGQASLTVNAVGPVTHFAVQAVTMAATGLPTAILVVALDASNQIVANYAGTVHFTSSDTAANLPADYTFQTTDNGERIFSVTFNTAGPQTVTATDTAPNSTVSGTANVQVTTGPPLGGPLPGGPAPVTPPPGGPPPVTPPPGGPTPPSPPLGAPTPPSPPLGAPTPPSPPLGGPTPPSPPLGGPLPGGPPPGVLMLNGGPLGGGPLGGDLLGLDPLAASPPGWGPTQP